MTLNDWFQIVASIGSVGGWVCLILLSIDKWVHKQNIDGITRTIQLSQIEQRQAQIERLLVDANTMFSRKHSESIHRLGKLELDMREVRTLIDTIMYRHSSTRSRSTDDTGGSGGGSGGGGGYE